MTLTTGHRVHPKPKALVALYGYGELNADWYAKPNPYPNYNMQKITREEAMQQTDGRVISDAGSRKGESGKIYMYYRQTGLWPQEVSGFSPETIAKDIAPYEPSRMSRANIRQLDDSRHPGYGRSRRGVFENGGTIQKARCAPYSDTDRQR